MDIGYLFEFKTVAITISVVIEQELV